MIAVQYSYPIFQITQCLNSDSLPTPISQNAVFLDKFVSAIL